MWSRRRAATRLRRRSAARLRRRAAANEEFPPWPGTLVCCDKCTVQRTLHYVNTNCHSPKRDSVRSTVAVGVQIAEAEPVQLHIQALPAEAENLCSRSAVVAGELQRRFHAQALDDVGRLSHQVLQRGAAHLIGETFDGLEQLASG